MPNFVPHSVAPRAAGRRISGSAFRLGGLALSVAPTRRSEAMIPRPRRGAPAGEGRCPGSSG